MKVRVDDAPAFAYTAGTELDRRIVPLRSRVGVRKRKGFLFPISVMRVLAGSGGKIAKIWQSL